MLQMYNVWTTGTMGFPEYWLVLCLCRLNWMKRAMSLCIKWKIYPHDSKHGD